MLFISHVLPACTSMHGTSTEVTWHIPAGRNNARQHWILMLKLMFSGHFNLNWTHLIHFKRLNWTTLSSVITICGLMLFQSVFLCGAVGVSYVWWYRQKNLQSLLEFYALPWKPTWNSPWSQYILLKCTFLSIIFAETTFSPYFCSAFKRWFP